MDYFRFRNIVLSETEPRKEDLWFRKKGTSSDLDPSAGASIWWFSPTGWKPLLDRDTRYEIAHSYSKTPSSSSLTSTSTLDSKTDMVSTSLVFSVYDGSRVINKDSANFVLESGLYSYVNSHLDILLGDTTKIVDDYDTISEISLALYLLNADENTEGSVAYAIDRATIAALSWLDI